MSDSIFYWKLDLLVEVCVHLDRRQLVRGNCLYGAFPCQAGLVGPVSSTVVA